MRIIALVNQKGGCGKTTTAINLAAVAAASGKRTLLVDMDPQGHCAAGLGIPEDRVEGGTTAILLGEYVDRETIFWDISPTLKVLPSTVLLSSVEAGAAGPRSDRRLGEFLQSVRDQFDLCLIDCPPSLGLLTMAALQAAQEALIPVETGYFSLKGAQRQWDTIEAVVRRLGRSLQRWVLPTIHDTQSRISGRILETLRRQFTGRVSPVVVHEHEALRESASLGLPVCELEPEGSAQEDFARLLAWLETTTPDPIEPTSRNGSRAAEILGRLRDRPAPQPEYTDQTDLSQTQEPVSSPVPQPLTGPQPLTVQDTPRAEAGTTALASCGVQISTSGVHFRQPGRPGQSMAIRGDFNGWSAIATPMRWDAQSGLFQALVALEPGTYRYQVVIDGMPGADPFNDEGAEAVGGGAASVLQIDHGQP
ncbi:MAG: AAA family ATPase [Phycisphaerales bacterium]|nr:AAA family ATPase [Phycisphaerales bacterium]